MTDPTDKSSEDCDQPHAEQCDADPMDEKEEKEISPATGEEMKKHEKWGRKGLTNEQQVTYWKQVIYWNKERFTEAKWREAVRRIARAAKENNVIVFGWHPPPPTHSINTLGGHPLFPYGSSSLTSLTSAHPLRPAHLPRIATSSTISRPRWDVVQSGPVTPLSATLGPTKNAFAEGGFWASLSPKTPATAIPAASTPIVAVPAEPWAPDTPRDAEAKIAYDEVKKDIRNMTLQLCANRLALDRLSHSEYDVIHPSMVKPKDELLAAELTLESRQLDLSKHLDPDLPAKVDRFADDEATCVRYYSIKTAEELEDIDTWLQFNESTGELTNVLEAQRDLFRMNRDRRKTKDIGLSEQAVQLAWAAKIVSDTEYITASRAEAESVDSDSDDEGYDYSNFVRSLRSKASSILGEDVEREEYRESGSARSSGSTTAGMSTDNDNTTAQPLSFQDSPMLPSYLATRTLPLRSLDSNTPSSSSSTFFLTPPAPPPKNKISSSHRKNLSIITHAHSSAVSSTASVASSEPLSPEERGMRHQGPSMDDLNTWADELRKMERKRTEMRLVGGSAYFAQHSRASSSAGSVNSAVEKGKDKEKQMGKANGESVDGTLHPALRNVDTMARNTTSRNDVDMVVLRRGRRRTSAGTTALWRCEGAVRLERDGDGAFACSDEAGGAAEHVAVGDAQVEFEGDTGEEKEEEGEIEQDEDEDEGQVTPTLPPRSLLRPRPSFRLSPPLPPPGV